MYYIIYYIVYYILNILKVINTNLWNKVLREFHITMANIVFFLILGKSKTIGGLELAISWPIYPVDRK